MGHPVAIGAMDGHMGEDEEELIPVVVSCAVWGGQWKGKLVLNLCDNNMAVVEVVKAQKSKDRTLIMHLLRCLHLICAYWEIELRVEQYTR